MDYQRYVFMQSFTKPFVLWLMGRNSGKALDINEDIPTVNGFKKMKDIEIGDFVFDEKGEPVEVINTSEIFENHDCYKITFEDNNSLIADENHIWSIMTNKTKKLKTMTTKELFNKGTILKRKDGYKEFKYKIPNPKPINYKKKELTINPYILGLWLGDGNSRDTRLTSHIYDAEEIENYINEKGYSTIKHRHNNIYHINIGYQGKGKNNKFKNELKKLNLIKNKHIPKIYLLGSYEQRLELLQGLMDTDGTCYIKNNRKDAYCEFSQKDYSFIKDVSELISSLGIRNKIHEKNVKLNGKLFKNYIITFRTTKSVPCFKMKRKYNLLNEELSNKNYYTKIKYIEKVPSIKTKCIMVNGESKLYLCTKNYKVTHNSTLSSPFNMTKMMLFPNFNSYILSLTASQSQDTFMKMEAIAKKQIESFTGLTDIFLGEVSSSVANHDGFIHNPSGFYCRLYNNSKTTTVSGDENSVRGKRSNLNIYDESGFVSEVLNWEMEKMQK